MLAEHIKSTLRTGLLLIAALCATGVAQAGPVSGTLYDTDYLKAQSGGFQSVQYPRYTDTSNNDLGQMIYPNNDPFMADYYDSYALVVDTTTGTAVPIQVALDSQKNAIAGEYTYQFSYLPPGKHTLMLVEAYRAEVYKPSSKTLSITVPTNNASVSANFNLVRQWRYNSVVTTATASSVTSLTGISEDFLTKTTGWAAVSTYIKGNTSVGYGHYAVDVYQTLNAGATWTKKAHLPSPVINNFGPWDLGSMVPPQYGIHFSDALHGTLLAQVDWNFFFWGNGLLVMTTSDGGNTWTLADGVGWTPATWSDPANYKTLSGVISNSILFVNDFYNGFTNEVGWDPSNRLNGVMYGVDGYTPAIFTRVTHDGGNTWQTGVALSGAPDIGASQGNYQEFFVFGGNNFTAMATTSSGVHLYDTAGAWLNLTDTSNNNLETSSAPYLAGRASGQSAFAQLQNSGSYHLYRTNNGGHTWSQHAFYNGGDGYGGSLAHSYSFLAAEASLMPDNSVWLWGPSQTDDLGRSMDSLNSRSWMGELGLLLTYSASHQGHRDASLDVHTGRRLLLMDPAVNNLNTSVLSFSFDDEVSPLPGRILPYVQYVGPHYNAGSGLYCNFLNIGGSWATNIVIDSITTTNGVTFSHPPLPWNIGDLPPASGSGQAYSFKDPGEIFFPLANVPQGVQHFGVTLKGHYNNGQLFQTTLYTNP